jgi:hypothetical protein
MLFRYRQCRRIAPGAALVLHRTATAALRADADRSFLRRRQVDGAFFRALVGVFADFTFFKERILQLAAKGAKTGIGDALCRAALRAQQIQRIDLAPALPAPHRLAQIITSFRHRFIVLYPALCVSSYENSCSCSKNDGSDLSIFEHEHEYEHEPTKVG